MNGCYLDETLERFQLWWKGSTSDDYGELLKNTDLAADPDWVPALPVLFPLTFLRAFALRICTHILFQMAGEKPYEVRVSWDSPASRRRAAADLVSGCEKSEGLKNWL